MSNRKQLIRVRDVMKPNYDMIDGKLTVEDALRAMRHVETKTLIVEKRDEDDEYGVVLISDIAKQVLANALVATLDPGDDGAFVEAHVFLLRAALAIGSRRRYRRGPQRHMSIG